jgi:predicted dehydrogenase
MTIRIGIIGCGQIARSHLKAFETHGVKITAVTDTNLDAARKFAEEAGGVACFPDYASLLDSRTVDAVSVCTPPTAHEEAVLKALKQGIHVLCEKPMAHRVESARSMASAAKKSKALFMIAFPHRFRPAIETIRQIVREGRLGRLVFFDNRFCGPLFWVEGTWRTQRSVAGGGILLDVGSHCVDLFRFIVGEVVEQRAVSHRHFDRSDVEDAGMIVLKAENSALGTLSTSWVAGVPQHFINIIGQKGRLYYDFANPGEVELTERGASGKESIRVHTGDGFNEEVGHFLDAVRGEVDLSCTAHDGLRAMEIVMALYTGVGSQQSGVRIRDTGETTARP